MFVQSLRLGVFAVLGVLSSALACGAGDMTSAEGEGSQEPELAAQEAPELGPAAVGEARQALLAPAVPSAIPLCPVGVVTSGVTLFNGGDESDDVTGTVGSDKLLGGLCNDTLSGLAGDDILDGGPGNDTLQGGNGNDELHGGEGNDTLQGGNQNDVLFGGPGADVLEGGNDDDELHGGCGPQVDTLDGGPGFDLCEGNCERDIFISCEVIRCC